MVRDFLVDTIKHPDFAEGELTDEVRRHIAYGMTNVEYYSDLINSLEMVIRETLGADWSEELEEHWHDAAAGMKAIIAEASTHVFDNW